MQMHLENFTFDQCNVLSGFNIDLVSDQIGFRCVDVWFIFFLRFNRIWFVSVLKINENLFMFSWDEAVVCVCLWWHFVFIMTIQCLIVVLSRTFWKANSREKLRLKFNGIVLLLAAEWGGTFVRAWWKNFAWNFCKIYQSWICLNIHIWLGSRRTSLMRKVTKDPIAISAVATKTPLQFRLQIIP